MREWNVLNCSTSQESHWDGIRMRSLNVVGVKETIVQGKGRSAEWSVVVAMVVMVATVFISRIVGRRGIFGQVG